MMFKIYSALALVLPFAIIGINLSFTSPVYPLLAESRHISAFVVSLFFAFQSLPWLFVYLYIPSLQRNCGTKRIYILHMLVGGISVLLMSSLHFIHSSQLFAVVSLVLQLANGTGAAGINYQGYQIAKRLFPNQFALLNELPVLIFLIFQGVGPILSAQATAHQGFHVACYIVGVISLLVTLFTACLLPSRSCEPEANSLTSNNQYRGRGLSYRQFLSKMKVLTSLSLIFLAYFLISYYLPFFSIQLYQRFKIPESSLGNFFTTFSIAGALSATPGILLLRRCLRLGTIMAIGVGVALVGTVLMGFCPLFQIPHQIGFVWAGIIFVGCGFSLMSAPFLPYIVEYYERHPAELQGIEELNSEDQKQQILRKSVASFSLFNGVGFLVAPIIGQGLYKWLGYEITISVVSAWILILGILFLIFGGVFDKQEELPQRNMARFEVEEEEEVHLEAKD